MPNLLEICISYSNKNILFKILKRSSDAKSIYTAMMSSVEQLKPIRKKIK